MRRLYPFTALFLLVATPLLAGTPALPHLQLQPVLTKLQGERPLWMAEAPDDSGRLFVVYQPGRIMVTKKGSDGDDAKTFLDITDRHPDFENECGLLSLAFHPGFKTNGLFYIYYNQRNPASQNLQPLNFPCRSLVSEFQVATNDPDAADLRTERILLQVPQPFGNHKGGELAFGPDGYLYLGLGDGGAGDDPLGNGQSTATLLAKILRLDVNSRIANAFGDPSRHLEYGLPSDNPFVDEPNRGERGARKEIYAYGLRNPWRYSWDRATGALWIGDVGQDLWEAVYLGVKGGNYGWSVLESGHHFKPGPPGAQYLKPVVDYPHRPNLQPEAIFPDHSIGLCVIGGYVYRGKESPALDGVYIYGDYNLGTIWGLRYDYAAQKVTAHGTLLQQPDNICSFAEDASGEVYALMQDGKIFKLVAP